MKSHRFKSTRPIVGKVIPIIERHEPEPPPSAPGAVARSSRTDRGSQARRASRVRLEIVASTGVERGSGPLPSLRARAKTQISAWLKGRIECVWWEYELLAGGGHVKVLRHGGIADAPADVCMTLERFPGVLNPLAVAAVEEWNRIAASAEMALYLSDQTTKKTKEAA
jgi:hypothetical protein